ncbi:MAG TPA: ATP-binding protein [Candidatus Acidoferrum sp.]|nr:ATP-binding protein [Candidatus Acidoferrum sp.]
MIRTIYTKIFLWFWGATTAVTLCVVAITVLSGGNPAGRRWMAHTLDFYAQSAVELYAHGGDAELNAYLGDLRRTSGMDAALIGPNGNVIGGGELPSLTSDLVAKAQEKHRTEFRAGLRWAGAAVVTRPDGAYVFAVRIYPLRGYWRGRDALVAFLRLGMAIVAAGILCFLLARHIASPIRALRGAAARIADGDLSVRAMPAITPRDDELADLAKDFDRMAERIQTLLAKQQEMLGDISHELRSPLARLTVSTELARRGEKEALDQIDADIARMDGLIGQILLLTRMQTHEDKRTFQAVNLRQLLEQVVKDAELEAAADAKGIALTMAQDWTVQGDARLLRSCFENILRNAVRYTKPGTEVSVRSTSEASATGTRQVSVEVTDQGPGVPVEALERIFEPFYRVSESRERDTGGTGLGLAIAHKVALVHGGRIEARNLEKGGLVVCVTLPVESVNS